MFTVRVKMIAVSGHHFGFQLLGSLRESRDSMNIFCNSEDTSCCFLEIKLMEGYISLVLLNNSMTKTEAVSTIALDQSSK